MNLSLSDEEHALVSTFHGLFEKSASPTAVRDSEPLGFDPQLWKQVVAVGATTMATPFGGVDGATFVQLALVAECAGRFLAPVPLIEAWVATRLIERSEAPHAAALLSGMDTGAVVPTLALQPPVNGLARLVPAGAVASLVVAVDGDELIAVTADPPAVSLRNLGALPIADRRLVGGRRFVLASGARARTCYEQALAEWYALTGAALVGLAGAALSIGVEYAKTRVAFGAPIATFQTVSHRLADRATEVDGARLLALEAACAWDEQDPRASVLSRMAFCFATETALDVTRDALHFHGGYGFTAEYDIQLYFRRAKAWSLIGGDPAHVRAQLGEELFSNGG